MQNGNGKARKSGSPGQTHLLYFALYWIKGGGEGFAAFCRLLFISPIGMKSYFSYTDYVYR